MLHDIRLCYVILCCIILYYIDYIILYHIVEASERGPDALAAAFPQLDRDRAAWLCFDLSFQDRT